LVEREYAGERCPERCSAGRPGAELDKLVTTKSESTVRSGIGLDNLKGRESDATITGVHI
jgi:hypothetical protein